MFRTGTGLSKKMQGIYLLMLAALLSLILTFAPRLQHVAHASGSIITNVNTDKARYNPGATVTIFVDMTNNSGSSISNGSVTLYFKHLNKEVSSSQTQTLNLATGASTSLSWTWTTPTTDFQGYSIEVWVRDGAGNTQDNYNTAVDVSSDWTKFPRYGYVATYPSQDTATSANIIWQLKNYHIDALQFYDWQWKHHIPLAGTVSAPASSWNDVGGRTNYRQTVMDYLNASHGYNMLGFSYNAANAAYADYGTDGSGVNSQWGLYDNSNCTGQDYWNFNGWGGVTSGLYLFNPADSGWQNYIANRENDMYAAYPFDGWHVDQLVTSNSRYTCSGSSVDVYSTFPGFLSSMKAKTNKRLIFNSSGGTALSGVAASGAVDALYTEWFSGKSYGNVKSDIDYALSLNSGKQPVDALYMDQNHVGSYFGTPGVLLTDATIFASGGAHIELGDGSHMLDGDYYPDHTLAMSSDLQRQLHNYYDFMVAYENLLRGGLTNTSNTVQLNGISTSTNSTPGTVYEFTKSGNGYDTINLINLLGETSNDAFDANGDRPAPTAQSNVTVKYYYGSGTINSVDVASPDYQNGKSIDLNFSTGSDGNGNYVTFTVPSLAYWDMIYLNKTSTAGTQLFFDDFESGSSSNWTPYNGSWSVCQVGGNSKEYCGSNTSEDISLAGSSSWNNYNVQGYVVAGGTSNTGICLLGRVKDGSHFYQAELKNGNTWDIYKNNGGSWTQIASGGFTWSANSYYLIRFDLNGNTLTMSYSTNYGSSWNTLGSGNDNSSSWSAGQIGVRVWGTTGRFDQIKVITD